jgi:hypothetical protein
LLTRMTVPAQVLFFKAGRIQWQKSGLAEEDACIPEGEAAELRRRSTTVPNVFKQIFRKMTLGDLCEIQAVYEDAVLNGEPAKLLKEVDATLTCVEAALKASVPTTLAEACSAAQQKLVPLYSLVQEKVQASKPSPTAELEEAARVLQQDRTVRTQAAIDKIIQEVELVQS